jgi:aspartyl-tRNA(Asn)/glutamyl-tRNA(Gln) amidotransferase subunit B
MLTMDWETVIGLEIHAQLSTTSKMFSGASTQFGAAANAQACAVDIALPGVLPVANKTAVERAIRFGLAVNGNSADNISRRSIFARKSYFYPDLPKGYQISQYELPIIKGGTIPIVLKDGQKRAIRLTRAHLEEDAGKSLHEDFHGMSGIDLNRAGTPLLEIVSEPDMRSGEEAVAYAKAVHSLVRWIDICDGNMQEGSFRCDANVSVRPKGSETLGTRREIKNLNSFRFLQQAIEYEAKWQIETIRDGGTIHQATVLFNPDTGETRAMRSKEDAHDYRYFPDPDLLPLEISDQWIDEVKRSMPDLPSQKFRRFTDELALAPSTAAVIISDRYLSEYFEAAIKDAPREVIRQSANWIAVSTNAKLNERGISITQAPVNPQQFRELIDRIADGTISGKSAKEVDDAMWAGEGTAGEIIERRGLKQISDSGALEAIVAQVIAANPKSVEEYRAGKDKAFNALVGQAMKATRGKGNPAQINEILKKKLAG